MSPPGRVRGAALALALIVLAALSVLGIGGMQAATTELAMARNAAAQQAAFEAAASGIEIALGAAPYPISGVKTVSRVLGSATVTATIEFVTTTGVAISGYSLGASVIGVSAYHFEIHSVGHGPANAVSRQRQGFFVLGPAP